MAVTALRRTQESARSVCAVHPAILLVSLAAPALDLLGLAQGHPTLVPLTVGGCALSGLLLAVVWVRNPREAWLAAAVLAMSASAALRLAMAGAEAPLLSLLGVVALGVGGAFASPILDLDLESTLGEA